MAIREFSYLGKTYRISYEIKNQNKEKSILILHGWGANKELMIKAFESYLEDFKQIYIDLPGFGKSNIFYSLNSIKYTKIIQTFLKSLKIKPDIIMGHSFGGKIATLLRPKNLVLLSTAGIVEEKPFVVKLKIKTFKFFKMIGLGELYRLFATKDVAGMSRVMYETLKNVVDEDFREAFSKTFAKTLIFWGKGDKAVSVESGKMINRLIKNSEFFELDGDHFFFLIHSKFISDMIKEKFNNELKDENLKNDELKNLDDDKFDDSYESLEVFEREYKKEKNSDEISKNESKNFTKTTEIKKENQGVVIGNKFIYDKLDDDYESLEVFEREYKDKKDSLKENKNDENKQSNKTKEKNSDDVLEDLVLVSDVVKPQNKSFEKDTQKTALDSKKQDNKNLDEKVNNDILEEKVEKNSSTNDKKIDNKNDNNGNNKEKTKENKPKKRRPIRFSDIYKYKVKKVLKEIEKEDKKW